MSPRSLRAFALASGLALSLGTATAHAQEITCDGVSDFPCSIQVQGVSLQRVPTVFKFQARVAQAKLPVGEGVFNTVVVKMLRGTDVLCLEQFQNVVVRDSVLNLSIGQQMSCDLDDVIAENADLAFQVCLGGQSNCLKPVELATTPYAVKSNFATMAQKAHEANVAGQANYAHRLTADRDLFVRKKLGTGYFDFYTHPAGDAGALYSDAEYSLYQNGGFLQWTPVGQSDAYNLHIVGKNKDTDKLRELDLVVLATNKTVATGDMTVTGDQGTGLTVAAGGAHVIGDSDVAGTVRITNNTTVESGGLNVNAGGATVVGNSSVTGTLGVTDKLTVDSNGYQVTGDSRIDGKLTVSATTTVESGGLVVLSGGYTVTGDSSVAGRLTVSTGGLDITGPTDIAGTTTINGAATIFGPVVGTAGLTITGDSTVDGFFTATRGLRVASGGAAVVGDGSISGNLDVSSLRLMTGSNAYATIANDGAGTTLWTGPIRFIGPVTFSGGTIDPGQQAQFDARYVLRGDRNAISLAGGLTVTGGPVSLVAGGGNPLTLGNSTALSMDVGGDLRARSQIVLGSGSVPTVPLILTRVVPAGQGGGADRNELLLYQGDNGQNASGPDTITLRAPGLRLQTYSRPASAAGIGDNGTANDRLSIGPTGDILLSGPTTVNSDLRVAGYTALVDFNARNAGLSGGLSAASLTATGGISGSSVSASGALAGGSGQISGNMSIGGILRVGSTPGDPTPLITSRTVPDGQNNGTERTELILFHSNDNNNCCGPDYITLRAPAIRLQTYNNAGVGDIDNDAGSNDRLYIDPAGAVTIPGSLTVNGGLNTWPSGSYCILRRGGSCPAGFSAGSRYHDDEDTRNANSTSGVLPDGSFGGDTLYIFCCK